MYDLWLLALFLYILTEGTFSMIIPLDWGISLNKKGSEMPFNQYRYYSYYIMYLALLPFIYYCLECWIMILNRDREKNVPNLIVKIIYTRNAQIPKHMRYRITYKYETCGRVLAISKTVSFNSWRTERPQSERNRGQSQ